MLTLTPMFTPTLTLTQYCTLLCPGPRQRLKSSDKRKFSNIWCCDNGGDPFCPRRRWPGPGAKKRKIQRGRDAHKKKTTTDSHEKRPRIYFEMTVMCFTVFDLFWLLSIVYFIRISRRCFTRIVAVMIASGKGKKYMTSVVIAGGKDFVPLRLAKKSWEYILKWPQIVFIFSLTS